MLTRREMLKMGLLGCSSLLPLKPAWARVPIVGQWGSPPPSPPTTPFQVPLPLPQVLGPTATDATTDYYNITMRPAQVQIIPGYTTTIWGYNGLYPGPTIKARSGRRVVVNQTNNLAVPTSVHLHGGHTPPDSDGHPCDVFLPGTTKQYTYPNNQIAATLWYHDHALDVTGLHVYMGLAGFYILQDDVELGLNLPSGSYDIPLVIQDRQFNSDGSLYYPPITSDIIKNGFEGDTILVNGAVQPYFQVANRKYRFRILNGSNASGYQLTLENGSGGYGGSAASFIQIGTDGGLISAPVTQSSITLWGAERVEVIIDFSQFPVGTQLILKNNMGYGNSGDIMRFDVVRQETDSSTVPSSLRPLATLPAASVTRNINLEFDRNRNRWVLNGKQFDCNRIDQMPRLGATEIWTFNNRSGMVHPMHIHDIMFQIVGGDGGHYSSYGGSSGVAGWKDTVAVGGWDTVQVKTQFLDNTGRYVFHCHKLEHEDFSMMGQFQVV
jgi:spore coat protein A